MMNQSNFYFGADYYPEHWPESRWPEDARLMAEAGFNLVRLAEFAWSKMEPEEGRFAFDWLDRAIDLLTEQGIRVVLGTPTASPPPWVMAKDEELFMVKENGVRLGYGNRREYCPNHPLYHEHTRKIVAEMAQRYRDHPAVIGWQIDNEFGSRCFCDICGDTFHDWLKKKYSSLDELNEKWGTIFWSHIYNKWEEIPIPISLGSSPLDSSPNPGLALDYFRFMSDTYVSYQKMQVDILRGKCPGHFITHNFMGIKYPLLNYFDLAADLDFVSWDNYQRTQWNMHAEVNPSHAGLNHATMRGLKKSNFWVMEQQSGPGGWDLVAAPTKPGELRLWAYQAIAHGADAIVFFRWRTCRFGTEEYWHGVLDHHGIPGRRYQEIAGMGAEISKVGDQILGAQAKPKVAVMQSYDTRFAFQIQPLNPKFDYENHFQAIYHGFFNLNMAVDVISENDDLSDYRLVIVPTMYVLSEETSKNLEKFAKSGGVVVFTALTGVKDEANAVIDVKLPGLASAMSGVEVEEYLSMPIDGGNRIRFELPELEAEFPVPIWADVLTPKGAQVVARYSEDFIAGKPAATLNQLGKGQVIYLGALGDAAYYEALAPWLAELAGVQSLIGTPAGVEVSERWQGETRVLFVLNHSGESQEVVLDFPCTDLLSGKDLASVTSVAPRDVLILVEKK